MKKEKNNKILGDISKAFDNLLAELDKIAKEAKEEKEKQKKEAGN